MVIRPTGDRKEHSMNRFQIGHKYYMRSACDYNCIWVYEVTARTEKTVKLVPASDYDQDKTPFTCRIGIGRIAGREAEAVRPLGRYSMAPVLSADYEYITAGDPEEQSEEITTGQ